MPRFTTAGNVQVNLSLPPAACRILQRYAPTRKAYGRLIGELLLEYELRQRGVSIDERLERIERLDQRIATGVESLLTR